MGFIKVISAAAASGAVTLFHSLASYVPAALRDDDTYYFSFSYEAAFGFFLVFLPLYLFVVMPISLLADGVVRSWRISSPIYQWLSSAFVYAGSGVLSGLLLIMIFRLQNHVVIWLIPVYFLVFLVFQSLFVLGLRRRNKQG